MRIVFLETVAGVPGSIAGILRHLASLRRLLFLSLFLSLLLLILLLLLLE